MHRSRKHMLMAAIAISVLTLYPVSLPSAEDIRSSEETIETIREMQDLPGLMIADGVSVDIARHAKALYSYLPENAMSIFEARNTPVQVWADSWHTEGHAGLTRWGDWHPHDSTNINVNGTTYEQTEMAVLHEAGHGLDLLLSDLNIGEFRSDCSEFREIYKRESGQSGYDPWCVPDHREYFAESFRWYFEDRDRVKQNTPMTYEYVKKFVENLPEQ